MKNKILLSIWSDPSMYLNLLFLINFFLKKKFKVILVCKKIERKNDFYYFVKKNRLLQIIEIKAEGKLGYFFFYKKMYSIINKFQPSIMISFNFISLFFSYFLKRQKINWIYYNFDFNITNKFNINNFIEKKIIKKVNCIFLPSESRVNYYKIKFEIKKKIYSINNCFSKDFNIKIKNKYDKYDKYDFIKKKKYLIRLGSFFSYHYLEELVQSTKYWSRNYKLILAGKSYNGYYEKLNKFIKKKKIENVILFKNISYELWFFLLRNAYAGFAMYEPINVSHKFMGGTSQKLNNYIFASIPSIISKSHDNKKFNIKYKTSILSGGNFKEIAEKTNILLENKKIYMNLKKNNQKAFSKEFNFEKQITRVLKFIS